MNEPTPGGAPRIRWVTRFAGGYLIFLFILLAVFALFVVRAHRPRLSAMIGIPTATFTPSLTPTSTPIPSPTPTPTATPIPTPQILVHAPSGSIPIRFEDFSSNNHNWSLYYADGKVQVIEGKLIVQSYKMDQSAMGYNPFFMAPGNRYYVQADFMTDRDAGAPYGLVFGLDESAGTYYWFGIQPHLRQFALLKHDEGKWSAPIPSSSGDMKPYPAVNTLSAYFEGGRIELYINGSSVAAYTDPQPFPSGEVGVLAGDASFQLIVDNFFAYSEK